MILRYTERMLIEKWADQSLAEQVKEKWKDYRWNDYEEVMNTFYRGLDTAYQLNEMQKYRGEDRIKADGVLGAQEYATICVLDQFSKTALRTGRNDLRSHNVPSESALNEEIGTIFDQSVTANLRYRFGELSKRTLSLEQRRRSESPKADDTSPSGISRCTILWYTYWCSLYTRLVA